MRRENTCQLQSPLPVNVNTSLAGSKAHMSPHCDQSCCMPVVAHRKVSLRGDQAWQESSWQAGAPVPENSRCLKI